MGHNIDLGKYNLRTDLINEAIQDQTIDGIDVKTKWVENVKIITTHVLPHGGKTIGRKPGNYITIEFEDITDYENQKKLEKIFAEQLGILLSNMKKDASCLVIGLGNSKSTPDALGPLCINDILVTNHLFLLGNVESGFRRVSAFTPGVMGQTGIETSEIIESVVKKIKPDFVLVIDALASQSILRVNRTIQMTNTGIHPGSGIGNSRKEISEEVLHIPVIAIGIPTVVDAVTIVSDTIQYMQKHYSYSKANQNNPLHRLYFTNPNYLKEEVTVSKKDRETLLGMVGTLNLEEVKQLLLEVLTPIGVNLMVTPKEVDFLIEKLSKVLANGINMTLHEKVNLDKC